MFAAMFSGIKGIIPDRTFRQTLFCSTLIANFLCLLGFSSGYVSAGPDGKRQYHGLVWDLETALYAVGVVVLSAVAFFRARYYKDDQMRWGARAIACFLPLLTLGMCSFGLVDLTDK